MSNNDPGKVPPQDRSRPIGDYINSERQAPQPDLNRSIDDMIERERSKRRNQP
ncbi:hypothetical protein AB8Z38_06780 [Bradyrhizobium sp. LLZ17]|uniref:Uncharacterized protein n=1 Tax=Bradyrhizobium sp. LLZ17 TaxID=3239388 RepID=A0AB39XR05_9BRAD